MDKGFIPFQRVLVRKWMQNATGVQHFSHYTTETPSVNIYTYNVDIHDYVDVYVFIYIFMSVYVCALCTHKN